MDKLNRYFQAMITVGVLNFLVPLSIAESGSLDAISSPIIRALSVALERGESVELDSFWKQYAKDGAPLIEPIEGEANHVWLSILWRATNLRRT